MASLCRHLPSLLNTAARSVAGLLCSDAHSSEGVMCHAFTGVGVWAHSIQASNVDLQIVAWFGAV